MDIEKQIDNYFKNWDKNSHGCLFTDQAVPVRLDTVKAVVKHFYDLGCRHTAAEYDDIEIERQNREEKEPKIRGWVARDPKYNLVFFTVKPERFGNMWDCLIGEELPMNPSLFPDLKWEDEPIEVELTIHKV